MGDWAVIRLDLDNPEEGELVKIIANVPLDWTKYTSKIAEEIGKPGRYVPALLLYDGKDSYYPPGLRELYENIEKESHHGE